MEAKPRFRLPALLLLLVAGTLAVIYFQSRTEEASSPDPEPPAADSNPPAESSATTGDQEFPQPPTDVAPVESMGSSQPAYRPWDELKRERSAGTEALLTGLVVDTADRPVGQARVSLFAGRDSEGTANFHDLLSETDTPSSGTFQFTLETPAAIWLVIDRSGFAPAEQRLFFDYPQTKRLRYVLREEFGVLRGVVLDKTSGSPLPGASVSMDASGLWAGAGPMRRTSTDHRGEFSFARLPLGVRAILSAFRDTHLPEMKIVALEEDNRGEPIELHLAPARLLPVRLVDESGTPVEGGGVRNPAISPMAAPTDSQGVAHVPIAAETASSIELDASAEGFLRRTAEVDPDGPPPEIVLERSALLRVQVFNQRGESVPQAHVFAWAADKKSAARGRTDENGFFQASPSVLPLISVAVSHTDYLGQSINLEGDRQRLDLQVTLEEGDSGMAGEVFSSRGQPLPAFRVWARRRGDSSAATETLTRLFENANGRFAVLPVPAGTYDLTIMEAPFNPQSERGVMRGLELRKGQVLTGLRLRLAAPALRDGREP